MGVSRAALPTGEAHLFTCRSPPSSKVGGVRRRSRDRRKVELGPWSLLEPLTKPYSDPMAFGALLAALINLNRPGHYVHWGFIQISVANLVVILLMVAIFVLAILLPFPRRKDPNR